MIPQSARQFNERLTHEDYLNDRYSDQLNQINGDIIVYEHESLLKLIYVGEGKTKVLLIDGEENLGEILNALVKRYGVSV